MVKELNDIFEYFLDIEHWDLLKREFLFKILSTVRSSELRKLVHDAWKSIAIGNKAPNDQLIEEMRI